MARKDDRDVDEFFAQMERGARKWKAITDRAKEQTARNRRGRN